MFGDWLEDPICYGVYENGILIGIVEGSIEAWNYRFRISNILVFEQHRKKGVGHQLMKTIIDVAKQKQARMAILETQSCNLPAITFYKNMIFK